MVAEFHGPVRDESELRDRLFQPMFLLELGVLLPQVFRQLPLQLLVFFLKRQEVIQIGGRRDGFGGLLPLIVGLLRYTRLADGGLG